MALLWGIDLGGTKIEVAVLNGPSADDVVFRHRIATEASKGYEHILSRFTELVEIAAKEVGEHPVRLGIGTPGSIDPPTQTLKNSNTTILNGNPFQKDLAKTLGIPVILANDANCFALAETRMGIVAEAVPNASLVFGVIMGTGVGGGVIINGQARVGVHSIAGEWGHNFLDDSGGKCYCGNIGCVEKVISGTALQNYYESRSGTFLKLREIVRRAELGSDDIASETMQRLTHFFGKGMASVINVLDPDAIVLGGGVSNIDLLYTEGVDKVREFAFNPRLDTPFLRPKLGDSAGVFGAALLVG